jgi:hypothetical protein
MMINGPCNINMSSSEKRLNWMQHVLNFVSVDDRD